MKHVERLGRVDEAKCLALLDAIQPGDWKAGSFTRFRPPVQGIYLLFRADRFGLLEGRSTEGYIDESHLWPHLAPLARELAEAGRGDIPGEMASLIIYRIPRGRRLPQHTDTWCPATSVRTHVPLQTDDRNFYVSQGERYNLDFGWAWRVNNKVPHKVINGSDRDRIHLISDWL